MCPGGVYAVGDFLPGQPLVEVHAHISLDAHVGRNEIGLRILAHELRLKFGRGSEPEGESPIAVMIPGPVGVGASSDLEDRRTVGTRLFSFRE